MFPILHARENTSSLSVEALNGLVLILKRFDLFNQNRHIELLIGNLKQWLPMSQCHHFNQVKIRTIESLAVVENGLHKSWLSKGSTLQVIADHMLVAEMLEDILNIISVCRSLPHITDKFLCYLLENSSNVLSFFSEVGSETYLVFFGLSAKKDAGPDLGASFTSCSGCSELASLTLFLPYSSAKLETISKMESETSIPLSLNPSANCALVSAFLSSYIQETELPS